MPQCVRRLVFSGYYRYDITFSEEASIQGYDDVESKDMPMHVFDPQNKESKKARKSIKITQIQKEECMICLAPFGHEPDNVEIKTTGLFRTPCNHRFHKKCLKDWMIQKHQCPMCRQVIPQY